MTLRIIERQFGMTFILNLFFAKLSEVLEIYRVIELQLSIVLYWCHKFRKICKNISLIPLLYHSLCLCFEIWKILCNDHQWHTQIYCTSFYFFILFSFLDTDKNLFFIGLNFKDASQFCVIYRLVRESMISGKLFYIWKKQIGIYW